jgi:cellulose biosynthesis protein BcsQ
MDRIAIALSNHKGGVGKTTLAVILTENLLKVGHTVTAIDLDLQRNFTDSLALLQDEKLKGKLTVANTITDAGDFMILDCPPAIGEETTKAAIDFADIILIPVMADLFSLINLEVVYDLGNTAGKTREQMPLVSVGFKNQSKGVQDEMRTQIAKRNYFVAADIPFNRSIPLNIMRGLPWEYGLKMDHRRIFANLLKNVECNYTRLRNDEPCVWGRSEK